MKHLTKRVLSVVISLIMLLSMFTTVPLTASATGESGEGTITATVEQEIPRTTLAEHAKANSWHAGNHASDGAASWAFDGLSNKWWHSNWGTVTNENKNGAVSASNPIWIQTGWGESKTINKFTYIGRTASQWNHMQNFKVYVSNQETEPAILTAVAPNDGIWTEVTNLNPTSFTGYQNYNDKKTATFDPVEAKWIRIVVTGVKGNNSQHVTASEIKIYEQITVEMDNPIEELTAKPLYKSHKIEWKSADVDQSHFSISKVEEAVNNAQITKVTVGAYTYYTALVPVASGENGNGTAYTVTYTPAEGETTTANVTVEGEVGLDALLANSLYVYGDTDDETAKYLTGSQVIYTANNENAVQTAKIKNLTHGSVVVTFLKDSRTTGNVKAVNFGGSWLGTSSDTAIRTQLGNGADFNPENSHTYEANKVYSYATTIYDNGSNNGLYYALNNACKSDKWTGNYKIFDEAKFTGITFGDANFKGAVYSLIITEESFKFGDNTDHTERDQLKAITNALQEKYNIVEKAHSFTELQTAITAAEAADQSVMENGTAKTAFQSALLAAKAITENDDSTIAVIREKKNALQTALGNVYLQYRPIPSATLKTNAKANSEHSAATSGDGNAASAFDGNTGSWWHSKYSSNGSGIDGEVNINGANDENKCVWIQTGWNSLKTITKIEYKDRGNGNNIPKKGAVYYTTELTEKFNEDTKVSASAAEPTWVLAQGFEFQSTPDNGKPFIINLDTPVAATGIRVAVTEVFQGNGDKHVAISDMKIYENVLAVADLVPNPKETEGDDDDSKLAVAEDGLTAAFTNNNIEVTTLDCYEILTRNASTNSQASTSPISKAFDFDNGNDFYHSFWSTGPNEGRIDIGNDGNQDLVSNKTDSNTPYNTNNPIWISTNFGGNAVDISGISFTGRGTNGKNNRPFAYELFFLKELPDQAITTEYINSSLIQYRYGGTIDGATKVGDYRPDRYYTTNSDANGITLTLGEVQKDVKGFIMLIHSVTTEGDQSNNVVVDDFRFLTPASTSANALVKYTAAVNTEATEEGTDPAEFAGWFDEEENLVSGDKVYICKAAEAKKLTAKKYVEEKVTVKFAVDSVEVPNFELHDIKHAFENKLTVDEALRVAVEGDEKLQKALEAYDSLKYNFEINMDKEITIEDNTCTIDIKKNAAQYKVVANVAGEQQTDTKPYNVNFEGIVAGDVDSSNDQFTGWYLTEDEEETVIATGTSYNYVATGDINITAKYEENSEASQAISVYIPEPVQSIQNVNGTNYHAVEVVVSMANVANTDGDEITVKENISSFGVVIVPAAKETEAIKTEITNNTAKVRTAYTAGGANNAELTNKGRYLHTLYFPRIPAGYKIYAFVKDTDGNITLSSGRDLQERAAITTAETNE